MRKTKLKFLLIILLFISSISFIGWNGAFNQVNDTSRLIQINEASIISSENSPLIINENNIDQSDSYQQNSLDGNQFSSNLNEHYPKSNYLPLEKPKLSVESVQYVNHSTISIIGDDDFARQDFPGNGEITDPYLIEDFEITANHTHLISIQDTTVYFNISNNQLNGVSGLFYGIRLNNVTNGVIKSNVVYQNSYGIRLDNSDNNNVTSNVVHDNKYNGIYLVSSSKVLVESNTAHTNVHGISFTNSWSNIINGNSVENNDGQGIAFYNSSYANIHENSILTSGQSGIYVQNSLEHDISHNIIKSNSVNGIVLHNTNGSTVNNNELAGNIGNGMLLINSHGNQILYNGISQNGANGITFINSNSNYIHHNDILDNYGSTIDTPIRYSRLSEEDQESIIILDRIMYSIKGTTSGHGIFLDPSSGNTIEFNNIYGNTGSGAYLYEASNTEFNENVVKDNGENGVFLENSNDNRLIGNIVNGNGGSMLEDVILNSDIKFSIQGTTSGHGIFLDPSMRNTIKGNEISHNVLNGIALFESEDSIIDDNIITKNGNGIYLEDSGHNSITYNTIAENGIPPPDDSYYPDIKFSITGTTSGHGIFLDPSDYNTIDHNTIFGNENLGIYLMDSDYVTITNNSISVNRLYGIFADLNSDETLVAQNDFHSNNWVYDDGRHGDGLIIDDGEHGDSQVRDDGEHGDFTGNYWNDLVGDIYYLAGLAENSDTQPAPVPFFPAGYEFTSPTVYFPNGGETLSNNVTIMWYEPSNEKYPGEISYYVFYSGNAGSNWVIIPFNSITTTMDATGLKILSIEWNIKDLPNGSEYLIKVVAVDEVGSVVSDTSDDVFQVENGIDTTTPSITPAWTIIGSLVSIGSFGWLTVRKNRNKKK